MKKISLLSLFFVLFTSLSASAINAEIGVNYNYKKSAFDASNNTEQQSSTGSVSLYLWEKIALELSYTNGLYVRKEKQSDLVGAFTRTTTQFSDIYGTDLIFILSADRKAAFQPFIKGGAAYVNIKQVVQDDNNNPWEKKYSGVSPSYGVGFKFFITEAFAIRASYDGIETPVDGNNVKVTDVSGRIGVSWML